MKAPLVLAFLCILALCYLAWAQQQQLVELELDVDRIRGALESKPAPKRRADGKFAKKEPT